MNPEIGTLSSYIDALQARGKYVFFKQDAIAVLQISENAFKSSIKRQKKRTIHLKKGLYLIIPIEYSHMGALPPNWYIHDLMEFLKIEYYVGLLSAAALYGSSHQAVQIYQVIVPQTVAPLTVGRAKVAFFQNAHIKVAQTQEIKVPSGHIIASTPEQTAFDLVKYMKACGGINNVATVLYELKEELSAEKLLVIGKTSVSTPCLQRLGFLLEHLGANGLHAPIKELLKSRKLEYIPLRPKEDYVHCPRDKDWKIIVNQEIEIDE